MEYSNMRYELTAYHGDSISVPQIVFSRLSQIDGNTLKVILHILQTNDTDPKTIARSLGLQSAETAKQALQYWAGAGLLSNGNSTTSEQPKQEKVNLAELMNDLNVASICQGAQNVFGRGLSRSEIQRLVGLYQDDGWNPDVILLCCAEVSRLGKNSVAAVVHLLAKWREEGIETGTDAERWLKRAERREQLCIETAEQFGLNAHDLTTWEKRTIIKWYEEMSIEKDMIDEAILRANGKNTVRYVDGILRRWKAQGITTIDMARKQGQLTGSNIIMTERPNAANTASNAKDMFSQNWTAIFDEGN